MAGRPSGSVSYLRHTASKNVAPSPKLQPFAAARPRGTIIAHSFWQMKTLEAELQKEKEARNYIRAAQLAEQAGLAEEARSLRKAALRQFLVEFNNFDGAAELISEYGLSEAEVQEVIQEALSDGELERRRTFCFDKGKPSHLSIAEQIRRFSARLKFQK